LAERPAYPGPDLRDERGYYRGPSKFHNQEDEVTMVDLLDLCDSGEERATMELLIKGYDATEIELETSTTAYGVRKIKKQIKAKLEKEGVRPTVRRRDPLDSTTPSDSVAEVSPAAAKPQPSTQELEIAISV
jgi:hypothetical protein